ncbi:two-component system, NtrC family, response regulator PilR [Methylomarinovum caldicuralii]|uniref:Two-component system, NtrC family, response regulator PilR n=1 Tax=Methylomarinovum caldicuralii TaxID=438856 RepID=A0AAU9C9I7_9GAMM|nr:sigma-54 dependent transcriptional regulator [Methylomarinovum caldicuralii]BCX82694.1 two-component system, NtrC family, response regulator PilR [Methylomarinovum caldicuralii]
MNQATALVVDDEPDILELLELTLARMNVQARCAATLEEAKTWLGREPFQLCLTDMRLPDGDGIDLVAYIQERFPNLPVAVITAHGNMEAAVRALKCGAFDFVSKPVDLQILRKLVGSAIQLTDAESPRDRRSRDVLLGDSAPMRDIRGKIVRLARTQAPVFIHGESGTGKELVARLIHAKSPRAGKPFVAVNCGAIPAELMESEFFGHKKGSFSGAVADHPGLFQAADGGTLFLDEVADLPLHLQVKLLRAIQEKRVRPVGGHEEIPVDVRILSATHKDLKALVDEGRFRQDLYYRINVIELTVPPLRQRREDIPLMADRILNRIARDNGLPPLKLTERAFKTLCRYDFPGNVRELENILERAAALCEGEVLDADDLHLPSASAPVSTIPSEAGTPLPEGPFSLEDYLGEIERRAILDALAQTRWNRSKAARRLGMTLRQLKYRLQKWGLDGGED